MVGTGRDGSIPQIVGIAMAAKPGMAPTLLHCVSPVVADIVAKVFLHW
jgi:hypothetical protein